LSERHVSLLESRDEVFVSVIGGTPVVSVGELECGVRFEEAEEFERVVVEERVRARRNLSLSGIFTGVCLFSSCLIRLISLVVVEELSRWNCVGYSSRLRDLTVLRTSRSSWFACLTEVVAHIR